MERRQQEQRESEAMASKFDQHHVQSQLRGNASVEATQMVMAESKLLDFMNFFETIVLRLLIQNKRRGIAWGHLTGVEREQFTDPQARVITVVNSEEEEDIY